MPQEQVKAIWDEKLKQLVPVSKQVFSRWVAAQPFTMLPLPVHKALFTITHVKDFHVLFGLCELAEFNTGRVFVHSSRRKDLMTRLKMTSQHLANSLKRLRDLGIVSGSKGEVILNPELVWKGTSAERAETLKQDNPDALSNLKSDFDNE